MNLALSRADPATVAAGSSRPPQDPPALVTVALDDGTWTDGEVIAVAKDLASRRWRILVRWYSPGPPRSMREDWIMHDPALIRSLDIPGRHVGIKFTLISAAQSVEEQC